MKGPLYINAASCISPQQTFGVDTLPVAPVPETDQRFRAIEPDYKRYLNIPAARRMSRMIKMGVSAALKCLEDAGVKIPDAIIAGTGLGCMEDSEKFLASLISGHEQTLSPTSFIFSTHNTVAAQIALLLQCNNYNFTHTHRGLSFENTLLDALLFLGENPGANVLAGAVDEMTDTSFTIQKRIGIAGEKFRSGSATGIPGEGTAFFSLGASKGKGCLAMISDVEVFSFPSGDDEIVGRVTEFCQRNSISGQELLLTGRTGNASEDKIYDLLRTAGFGQNPSGQYKQLCGNYHTSTAFACWLAAMMLKLRSVPSYIVLENKSTSAPDRIVIFNGYKGREYSLILLESC